jgi:restriction endonuclease S subunit/type I restriction-modification system DNA methylase subunit
MEFDQKGHYDRHLNKKIPCVLKDKPLKDVINDAVSKQVSKIIKEENKNIIISSKNIDSDTEEEKQTTKPKSTRKKPVKKDEEKNEVDYSYLRLPDNEILIELEKEDNKVKSEAKKSILKMIDKGHNYLYNSENIEGEDALNDIMNFLFIKSIQPIISDKEEDGKIDLLNKKYYKNLYDDKELTEILSYFQNLSNLSKKELNVIRNLNEDTDAIRQMGDILKNHPITKQIFTENNFIKAKKAPTIQLLLNEVIIPLNIKEIEQNEDVIGEIYEHIINGYVKKGSKLGQFFTPRKLMKLIFNYKEDRINEIIKKLDKKEKIKFYDSCMGTGGWLVTGYNLFKEKYGDRILLSGGEVKSTTFQYGLMNLILTLRKFPHDVKCESSLTHINTNKHHFVLTNPPFQTDKKFDQIKENFKSDEFTKANKIKLDDVYDLKDNSPPIQFLELDKFKLEENGLCLIILPYGELFFGSSNKDVRKHFMKETNITDIILFPGGVFTHAGVKSCALIFEKDKKGTKTINFIQSNKECTSLTKVTTVSIDDIEKEPNSSWYLRDYLKDEYIESLSSNMINFEWTEFKNVFTLEKGKIQSSKIEEDENGKYPVISKCQNHDEWKYTDEYKIDGENVFIFLTSNTTKFGITYYNGKCINTDLVSRLIINTNYKLKINMKYIYYYLKSNKNHIESIYLRGSSHQSIDINNLNRLKIPIPSIEEQSKIIQNITALENSTKNLKIAIEANQMNRKMYMEAMIKEATNKGINKVMKLGEVCEINNGKNITESQFIDGDYPVIGGGRSYIGYHNEYNAPENTITISKDGNTCGSILIHKTKIFVSNHGLFINSINNKITTKNYLYNYLLMIQHILLSYGKGSAQPGINKDDIITKVKIPIPPLDYQNKMEQTLSNLDKLDEELNKMIQQNEDNIQTAFLNSLDDYGNPNSFNIDKLIQSDSEEEIKEVPKNKNKTKSKSNII